MAGFKPADRFGYTITLPFGEPYGDFTISSPPYDVGVRVAETSAAVRAATALVERGEEVPEDLFSRVHLDDQQEIDWYADLLGADVLAEMKERRLPWEAIKLAASTVTIWITQDLQAAQEWFNAGGRPRPTKAPQDRKQKKTSRPTS